jgi:hypothetical protein
MYVDLQTELIIICSVVSYWKLCANLATVFEAGSIDMAVTLLPKSPRDTYLFCNLTSVFRASDDIDAEYLANTSRDSVRLRFPTEADEVLPSPLAVAALVAILCHLETGMNLLLYK